MVLNKGLVQDSLATEPPPLYSSRYEGLGALSKLSPQQVFLKVFLLQALHWNMASLLYTRGAYTTGRITRDERPGVRSLLTIPERTPDTSHNFSVSV